MSYARQLEALGIVKNVRAAEDGSPIFDFGENDHRAHMEQMFGNGYLMQSAAVVHEDKVLLLQLSQVSAIDVGGTTQCWIEPNDLAAGRFENALMTYECT